jgi:hypothetical protein
MHRPDALEQMVERWAAQTASACRTVPERGSQAERCFLWVTAHRERGRPSPLWLVAVNRVQLPVTRWGPVSVVVASLRGNSRMKVSLIP